MKKLFILLATAALSCIGCGKEYDDSALNGRVDNLENRIAKLEELCKQMNTNISSLQTIVTALQKNDYVTGVTPVTSGGKTIGYTITFAKSPSVTIYHGQDGKDGANGADGKDGVDGADGKDGAPGKDGRTPIIGVRQDTDGIYYWTLDGDWLLDAAGNKIKAVGRDGRNGSDGNDGASGADGKNGKDGIDGKDGQNGADGKDGITPQLKIENGYWFVSTDNGATWTNLGKATGADGKDGINGSDGKDGADGKDGSDSIFKSVTQDDTEVCFILNDGTTIAIPLASGSLFGRLQSVKYIPRYADGHAVVRGLWYGEENRRHVYMDFEVLPKDAATEIAASWQTVLSMKALYTYASTRASSLTSADMPIISCEADVENGVITLKASAENLGRLKYQNATARLSISDGDAVAVMSEYVPIKESENRGFTTFVYYTTDSEDAIEMDDDDLEDLFDAGIVSHTFEDGQGRIELDGYAYIRPYAFRDSDLKSFRVEKGAVFMDEYAFAECDKLENFEAYHVVGGMGKFAFHKCSSLKTVRMSEHVGSNFSITSISEGAFAECRNIEKVIIPQEITSIEKSAFSNCRKLTSINLDNITTIGEHGFFYCENLENIDIPNVTYLGSGAFDRCKGMTSIDLSRVTYIGRDAFNGWKDLTEVRLSNDLEYIAGFANCTGLTSIHIPEKAVIGENAFYGCKNLKSVNIPECNTVIDAYTFEYCESLESIDIPNSVTRIFRAFNGCSKLHDLVIPAGVTLLGGPNFEGCVNLKNIYLKPMVPPGASVSGSLKELNVRIYVPTESVEAYKNSESWRDCADQIESYDFND